MGSGPLLDVVAAAPDLLDAGGLGPELLLGPPGHRVQGGVQYLLAVVNPRHGAVVAADEPRRLVRVLALDATLEHVRRLDDVVIDADQDQVIDVHGSSLLTSRSIGKALRLIHQIKHQFVA